MTPHRRRRAPWLYAALTTAVVLGLSCSSLPTFAPDLVQPPVRPVPLEGARGPLSAAQSHAILQRLQTGGQPTDIFSGHLAREEAIGRQFAQALLAKQAQGVQVLEFNPVNPLAAREGWQWNQRDHRKLLIVDGQTAFLGGINISSVYSGGSFGKAKTVDPDAALAWRDTDLLVQHGGRHQGYQPDCGQHDEGGVDQ